VVPLAQRQEFVKREEDKGMHKKRFWKIIERTKDPDPEEMYAHLAYELRSLSKNDALSFNSYVAAYMELVNGTVWLDMACKVINGYVSDDTGLYFTLWVISRGENVLLDALNDPDSLSKVADIPFGDAEFEMLMSVGIDNLEEKAASNFELMEQSRQKAMAEIAPTIKFKGGEKYGDYEEFDDALEDIPNVLPKLIKRAEQAGFDWEN
jgi:hypothetical protein